MSNLNLYLVPILSQIVQNCLAVYRCYFSACFMDYCSGLFLCEGVFVCIETTYVYLGLSEHFLDGNTEQRKLSVMNSKLFTTTFTKIGL